MIEMKLSLVQDLFDMEDINKKLKLSSITPEQLERVQRFENHIKSQLKRLYVPEYPIENV